MTSDEERLDDHISLFFGWFRRRLANVTALTDLTAPQDPNLRRGTFAPEQHILIGSAIDALAIDWARVFQQELNRPRAPAGNRVSEFLRVHANRTRIFDRVAAPMLADHLQAEGDERAMTVVRRLTNDQRNGIVRFSDEDPEYQVLLNHPEVVALGLNNRPRHPKQLVDRFRYGQVIYSDYGCGWSHNLRGSDKLAASDHNQMMGCANEMDARVRYENVSVLNDAGTHWIPLRRPVFSLPWLLGIYREALESFERQCRDEGRDPWP